jgi:hypothetical protein
MKVENKPKAQLESQNDLGYITGHHTDAERARQVATPSPRRTVAEKGSRPEPRDVKVGRQR